MVVPLFVGRDKSVVALEKAMAGDKEIFLVTQLDPAEEDPDFDDLYSHGRFGVVMQLLKLPDGTVRVLVEGKQRSQLVRLHSACRDYVDAEVEAVVQDAAEGPETTALMRSVIDQFENYAQSSTRNCRRKPQCS
jgi:ATP-dependent Lon protease